MDRNTKPAIVVAALNMLQHKQDKSASPITLVLPADHNIENQAAFY